MQNLIAVRRVVAQDARLPMLVPDGAYSFAHAQALRADEGESRRNAARNGLHQGTSTIFPRAPGSITATWADGASASGISRLSGGARVPASSAAISAW